MKEKYSEYERADQHVERHAQLHHERHSVSGAGGGEEKPVFHRQKADDLRHRFLAHDHHEEGKQHAVERVSVVAICEIGVARAKAKITRPIPISMVVGILIRVSMSQRTKRRSISRCSTQGMRITFSSTVISAE